MNYALQLVKCHCVIQNFSIGLSSYIYTALHHQSLTPLDCSSLLLLCILFQDVYMPLLGQFTLIRLAFYIFQEIPQKVQKH